MGTNALELTPFRPQTHHLLQEFVIPDQLVGGQTRQDARDWRSLATRHLCRLTVAAQDAQELCWPRKSRSVPSQHLSSILIRRNTWLHKSPTVGLFQSRIVRLEAFSEGCDPVSNWRTNWSDEKPNELFQLSSSSRLIRILPVLPGREAQSERGRYRVVSSARRTEGTLSS